MIEDLTELGSQKSREWTTDHNLSVIEYYAEVFEHDSNRILRRVNSLFLHLILAGVSDFFESSQEIIRDLIPEGSDMAEISKDFEAIFTDLLLNGLRVRQPDISEEHADESTSVSGPLAQTSSCARTSKCPTTAE